MRSRDKNLNVFTAISRAAKLGGSSVYSYIAYKLGTRCNNPVDTQIFIVNLSVEKVSGPPYDVDPRFFPQSVL
jgi:uncharacterized protein (UPF0333 family)